MPGIFTNQQLEEVHLKNAPLVKALAQVRFPVILKLDTPKVFKASKSVCERSIRDKTGAPSDDGLWSQRTVPSATQGIVWRMSEVEGTVDGRPCSRLRGC